MQRPVVPAECAEYLAKIEVLERELSEARRREAEAVAYQTAIAEVLAIIAKAPHDLGPVYAMIAATARRLCAAHRATFTRRQTDGRYHFVATDGPQGDAWTASLAANPVVPDRGSIGGRTALAGKVVHVHDINTDPEYQLDKRLGAPTDGRTVLGVPLISNGGVEGIIVLTRTEVAPFSERQIELVETFAAQAVIAIENARLFEAEQTRTKELQESLEYQTAISDVLEAISRSPSNLEPVFEAIARSASHLCGGEYAIVNRVNGNQLYLVAQHNERPGTSDETAHAWPRPLDRTRSIAARAIIDRKVENIRDLIEEDLTPEIRDFHVRIGARSLLAAPIMHDEQPIGVIAVSRSSPGVFPARQVDLLRTFASQAAIAIENARLFEAEQTRTKELRESLEYLTASAEVLSVISRSPNDLQPVFDAIASTASHLCGSDTALIWQVREGAFQPVAQVNISPERMAYHRTSPIGLDKRTLAGRAALERQVLHVADVRSDPDFSGLEINRTGQHRSMLCVPLLRQGKSIGVIALTRRVAMPFNQRQIDLVATFADQAVIAIENARLFEAEQTRTKELTESLEYQTAISAVLETISRSPSEVQPVLDAIVETAITLCQADVAAIRRKDGDRFRHVASRGYSEAQRDFLEQNPAALDRSTIAGRVAVTLESVHVPDLMADAEIRPDFVRTTGVRSCLAVPMLQGGALIGVLLVQRTQMRPFTPRQIALVETFAAQAVIAIENARLLDELQTRQHELTESLAYQTAISEVLETIAHSPSDLQPVLDTISQAAVRLCKADRITAWRVDGPRLTYWATANYHEPSAVDYFKQNPVPINRGTVVGRAVLQKATVHVTNVQGDDELEFAQSMPVDEPRTLIGVPLMLGSEPIGAIGLSRLHQEPFTAEQIGFLETFASQAVIAIENARLLDELQSRQRELEARGKELQAKTDELTESLEYQTATSEVLGVISRSPNELQPVLDAIASTSTRLCEADAGLIWKLESDAFTLGATVNTPSERVEYLRSHPTQVDRQTVGGRSVLERRTVHIEDVRADPEFAHLETFRTGTQRTVLAVPLLRLGGPIGVIMVIRHRVAPFTPRQIALVETFANQAVIAINNVGLFDEVQARTRELTESLEYQTATSEVLSVISRSPNELQPVLDAITQTAARLCQSNYAHIRLRGEDGAYHIAAARNAEPEFLKLLLSHPIRPGEENVAGRAALRGETVHVPDVEADPHAGEFQRSISPWFRTVLAVPLKRAGEVVGVISLNNSQVQPFTQRQIELVTTFANQAVIAINNVGLFEEVQARTKELTESLEYQTAISDVLGTIASSPGELQPVLDRIVETAARLGRANKVGLRQWNGSTYPLIASFGFSPTEIAYLSPGQPSWPSRSIMGQLIDTKHTVHEPDISNADWPGWPNWALMGVRAGLGVPLLRDGHLIGTLVLWRNEKEPFAPELIALIETFADQAVIAIENARLLDELQTRQKELEARTKELTESLEYQTAISEVLSVISTSPTDLQPVLETIARNSARLCNASWSVLAKFDGKMINLAAIHNLSDATRVEAVREAYPRPLTLGGLTDQAMLTRDIVYERDFMERSDYPFVASVMQAGMRSNLTVPVLLKGEPVAAISVVSERKDAFSQRQIDLLKAFADQAVIAINNVGLFEEVQARTKELTESLEYQTATSEVLGVISRSPNELQPVLDAIMATAQRLGEADRAFVSLLRDGRYHLAASIGAPENLVAELSSKPISPGRGSGVARVALEKRTIQITDSRGDPEYTLFDADEPGRARTQVSVPLLRDNSVAGVITLARTTARPFGDRQIRLLETFADQAVIAINNVGLFEEVQARTKELTESLEYQTATAEVLSVISRSPDQLQPVLDAITQTAERLCASDFALIMKRGSDGIYRIAASSHASPELLQYLEANPVHAGDGSAAGIVLAERRMVHIPDLTADPRFTHFERQRKANARAVLAVPLIHGGEVYGVILLFRATVRPFTDRQINLVTTFAAQAVIAINNVGLFEEVQARTKELTESLEYQTATSDVLQVISSSPNELQPVLDAIVQTAQRLCTSDRAFFFILRDGRFHPVASSGAPEHVLADLRSKPIAPGDRGTTIGRMAVDRRTLHLPDAALDPEFNLFDPLAPGRARSSLAVPLDRNGQIIGAILVANVAVKPFTDRQIRLVETFANQAVIAINNVGLFEEVQTRTKELTESLEYQTATSEVLGVISGSPDKLQPVLDAIVQTAKRLCEADRGQIWLLQGDQLSVAAHVNTAAELVEFYDRQSVPLAKRAIHFRAITQGRTVHISDALTDPETRDSEFIRIGQVRSILSVPLMREGRAIGVVALVRTKVLPFTERQINLVTTFANQAVISINNVGLFEEVQARTRELQERSTELARSVGELQSLSDVGRMVSSTLDMKEVLGTVLQHACRMTYTGGGTIYVYDKASGTFSLEAGHNMSPEHIERVRQHPMRIGDQVVGECAAKRTAVQIEDLLAEGRERTGLIEILIRAGVRAILAVPLLHQGEVLGALVVRRNHPGGFSVETVRLLETFASQSAIAVNNARLFNEVQSKGRELQLASQHKSQFLANMSHELRTPLNAILGYTELLADGAFGEIDGEQRDTVERIERNGRHLLGLINDVLDLSKIEAGEMSLTLEEYSIASLVRTALVATEPLARQKGLKLRADIAEGLPSGHGDTRRLAQVLLNLIGNAIKFTDRGEVAVSAAAAGGEFRITVRDTGPGIAEADLGRIFEKFQQVDNTSTRKKGGTGLGLAISREFIEMHGGKIAVSSVLGEGAVFTITLPIETEPRRATLH